MKFISKLIISAVTISSLIACKNGSNNVPVNTANSAQKAAEEYSKTFRQPSTQQAETHKQPAVSKKLTTQSAGITGIPKEAVNGAKSVVDATKEIAGKAADKISEVKKDVVKAATGKEPVDEVDQTKNENPAKPVVSAQDAANEVSKTLNKKTKSDIQSVDQDNPNITLSTKKVTQNAGITGIPEEAVDFANSVVDETKVIAKEVVDKLSSAGKTVVDETKSAVGNEPDIAEPNKKDSEKGVD